MVQPLFAGFEPVEGPSLEVVMNSQQLAALIKNGTNNRETRLKLTKLMWGADRFSLRRRGRSVSQSSYSAMEYGPVSSRILDVIKPGNGLLTEADISYVSNIFALSGNSNEYVNLISDPGEDYLSDSDREFIGQAESTFRGYDRFYLAKTISHQYPEWKRHEGLFDPQRAGGAVKSVPIDNLDFFRNPEVDPFFNTDEEVLAVARQNYLDDLDLFGGKAVLV